MCARDDDSQISEKFDNQPTRYICSVCPAQNAILLNNRKGLRPPRDFRVEAEVLTETFIATINDRALRGCSLCRLLRQHYFAAKLQRHSYQRPPVPSWRAQGSVQSLYAQPQYWRTSSLPAIPPDHSCQFDLLKGWISQCSQRHESCGRVTSDTSKGVSSSFVPRRLLKVERAPSTLTVSDGEYNIRLLEAAEISRIVTSSRAGQPTDVIEYATLSYCWGPTSHDATTSHDNYELRRHTIIFNSLPKTFQDAIVTTIEIGLLFLWIDALCIIQPTEHDKVDWEEQSAQMADIYANSLINISATGSTNAREGLFYERPDRTFPLVPVAFNPESSDFITDPDNRVYANDYKVDELEYGIDWLNPQVPSFSKCILESPLNTRGWVLQERFFSPRIAHFTKQGLFWECADLLASDYEPDGIRDREEVEANQRQLCARRSVDISDGLFWFNLLGRYSDLDLTDKEDVLPAISGVVHWILKQKDDQYYAGILGSKLLEGLSWSVDEKMRAEPGLRKRIKGIPTWSWASVPTPISYAPYLLATWNTREPSWRIKVVNIDVVPSGTDPCGRVCSGRLTVTGVILTLDGCPLKMWRQSQNAAPNHFVLRQGTGYLSIDDQGGYEYVFGHGDQDKTIPFLVMMSSFQATKASRSGPSQQLCCEGLLLRSTSLGNELEFERIGWLMIYMDDVDLEARKPTTIVLL